MGRLARAVTVYTKGTRIISCAFFWHLSFAALLLCPFVALYFFQGGNVLRAGFSFLRPRAQSACMSV
jgi:hypothetical protein